MLFFPMNLIQVQGYTPTQAGAALLPFILLVFLLSRWSGGLFARYGARRPLTIGPLIAAAGLALFAKAGVGGDYFDHLLPARHRSRPRHGDQHRPSHHRRDERCRSPDTPAWPPASTTPFPA